MSLINKYSYKSSPVWMGWCWFPMSFKDLLSFIFLSRLIYFLSTLSELDYKFVHNLTETTESGNPGKKA